MRGYTGFNTTKTINGLCFKTCRELLDRVCRKIEYAESNIRHAGRRLGSGLVLTYRTAFSVRVRVYLQG